MVSAMQDQLRAPLRQQPGAVCARAPAFFPQGHGWQTKPRAFNRLNTIGTIHAARQCFLPVCSILSSSPCTENSLPGLPANRFSEDFEKSRPAPAKSATPHQMRHVAPSADALAGTRDATLRARTPWRSVQSPRLYQKPARFIQKRHLSPPSQCATAKVGSETILNLMGSVIKIL